MAKTKNSKNKLSFPLPEKDVVLPDEIYYKSKDEFLQAVKSYSAEQKQTILKEMRSIRNFYKKILEEDYRAINPNSHRYTEATVLLRHLNANGKELNELIT